MLVLYSHLAVFIFYKQVQFQFNVSCHPLLEDVDEMLISINKKEVL